MDYSLNGMNGGVKLNLGPVIENPVIEYLYDGTEKHARDYDLDELTADYAVRIDWRSILGADDTIEHLYNLRNMEITRRDNEVERLPEEKEKEHNDKMADTFSPEAGPWANVAKKLQ